MKQFFRPLGIVIGGVWGFVSCASESEFSRADTNNDQQVSTEEVEDRLIEAIFEKEDRNRDGKVTPIEWSAVNPNCSIAHFHSRDTNKDQAIGLDEFQKYADDTKMFDKALLKLDPNKDGMISSAESQSILNSVSQ